MDLLWTNENLEDNFEGQTVIVDLSNYKFVLVYCRRIPAEELYYPSITPVNHMGLLIAPANDVITFRYYTVNTTSIVFEHGHIVDNNNYQNHVCMPYLIYGIK